MKTTRPQVRSSKRAPGTKKRPDGDWGRFLQERHLLILDWVAEGKPFTEIAGILSMDPVQVQLISMTPFDAARFARERR